MNQNKVFGIGLSRTGTTSLNEALRILGYKSIHYPENMLYIEDGLLKINLDQKYNAYTDTPIARFYKSFDKSQKFIFTVRNKNDWLLSCKRFWERKMLSFVTEEIKIKLHSELYGSYYFEEPKFSSAYDTHYESVLKYFRDSKNLLIMDICGGDSWDCLCEFLEKRTPRREFPKENAYSP